MSNDEDTDDAFGYRLVAQSHLLQSPPGFFVNRYLPVAFWQSRRNLVYVKLNRNQGAALLGDFNIWHRSMKAIAAGLAAACHRPIRQNRLVKLPQRWRKVALRIFYCLSMSRPTAQKGAKTDFCCCAGFRPPGCRPIHAIRRPAAEKRQGTKSREVCGGGAAGAMGN